MNININTHTSKLDIYVYTYAYVFIVHLVWALLSALLAGDGALCSRDVPGIVEVETSRDEHC